MDSLSKRGRPPDPEGPGALIPGILSREERLGDASGSRDGHGSEWRRSRPARGRWFVAADRGAGSWPLARGRRLVAVGDRLSAAASRAGRAVVWPTSDAARSRRPLAAGTETSGTHAGVAAP